MAHPVLKLGKRGPLPQTLSSPQARRWLVSIACLVAGALSSRLAAADDLNTGSWHRHERPPESPQRFALELRFGPYHPNVDDQFPQTRPYETAFGASRHPLYLGLEFD